jgi:hypothetical protein
MEASMTSPRLDKHDKNAKKNSPPPKEQTPSNQRQIEREQQEGRGSGEGISGIQPGDGHPHGR